MEDSQAKFVTMVMDRLQAVEATNTRLEAANAKLLVQNQDLAARIQMLEKPLCLSKDLLTFSDGMRLEIHEDGGVHMRQMDANELGKQSISYPMDKLHADAIAFKGKLQFDYEAPWYPHRLDIGEEGSITSVQTMAQQMHAWSLCIEARAPTNWGFTIFDRLNDPEYGWEAIELMQCYTLCEAEMY